jgi:F-type H+-transporting ATPase subunit b
MMNLLFLMSLAVAEEAHHLAEGHGDPHAIPVHSLGVQAFNFAVLFIVLFFLLRKTAAAHFAHRAKDYKEMVEKAETARKRAESERNQIRDRLQKLESSTEKNIEQAKREAQGLREKLVLEAKSLAEKLEQEAKRTAAAEIEKAKAELRQALLEQSIEASRKSLKSNLGTSEQKKLHSEFVDKIQVVRG